MRGHHHLSYLETHYPGPLKLLWIPGSATLILCMPVSHPLLSTCWINSCAFGPKLLFLRTAFERLCQNMNPSKSIRSMQLSPKPIKMTRVFLLASQHEFVKHSIISLAATLNFLQTQNETSREIAAIYRDSTIKGLQNAIASFSPQNSDAIISASFCMSWEAQDW